MSLESRIQAALNRPVNRREMGTATLLTGAALVLTGCGKEAPNKPDQRLVTDAEWITDEHGNIVKQTKDGNLSFGARLTLQPTNKVGLNEIDITVSPYNGSQPDTTFSKDGFPIVAFQRVRVSGNTVTTVPAETQDPPENPSRITLTQLNDGKLEIQCTVPLDNPSYRTDIHQPAIPVGQQLALRIDVHGVERGQKVDQLNVVGSTQFIRQPAQ